jgi:O-acetyl-ADP-ribose deacetylase (regulator of RNase III)
MNQILQEYRFSSGQCLQLVHGDLTQENVDAIVNAANKYLAHGGGVAAAIVRRGGEKIQVESDAWVREHGPVRHDLPAYTSGGNLPCRFVIHAVGPIWGEGDEDLYLTSAISGALSVADQLKLASIAFPAISTGIFGFPKERAAQVILNAIEGYFARKPESSVKQVRLTLYDQPTLEVFRKIWEIKGLNQDDHVEA